MNLNSETEEFLSLILGLNKSLTDFESGINRNTKTPEYLMPRADLSSESEERVFPLDFNLIMLYEALIDEDLRKVRIHTGGEADNITKSMGASAVTTGHDIYFSPGTFSTETEEGQMLIAHELEHVKQYIQNRTMRYQEDVEELEHEASRVESAVSHREDQIPLEDTDLKGFTNGTREELYRIHLPSGSVFTLRAEEYEGFKDQVKESLLESLEDDMRWNTEEELHQNMNALIKWLGA